MRIDSLDERWFANKYVGATRIEGVSLDARHLLHVSKPTGSATAIRAGFPSPVTIDPLGESLGVAAVGAPAARTVFRGYWIWVSVAGGSLFLFLAGGVVVRRRHRLDVKPRAGPSG